MRPIWKHDLPVYQAEATCYNYNGRGNVGVATTEAFMRTISLLAAVMAALSLSSIAAKAQARWCANYGGPAGGTNCGFHSFEQCRANVSGIGGFCQSSPGTTSAVTREPRRTSYRRAY